MEKYAILIGIDDYIDAPLKFCVRDATEIAAALSMMEYKFNVIEILNHDATKIRIKEELDNVLKNEPDMVLLYFSGHGWQTKIDNYLATIDGDKYDEGIEFDYLRKIVDLYGQETSFVFILDCCHSGSANINSHNTDRVPLKKDNIQYGLIPPGDGRAILAACQADDVSWIVDGYSHSIFTYFLLKGLMGDAADSQGEVTVTSLYDYISKQTEIYEYQMPVFKSSISGRFILGDGFQPIEIKTINEDSASSIEFEAEEHTEYLHKQIPHCSLYEWKHKGHKDACNLIEPIFKWFKNKINQHPQLLQRQAFKNYYDDLIKRLADLARIEIDTILNINGVVKERIGSGTFGTVYKVELFNPSGIDLAFKVYHPQDIYDLEKLKRFNRGYEAMRQLDHPHIVKVHRYTECPIGFYMDYIDGPNLREFAGTLDLAGTLRILLTVAETLAHTHGRRVVHRDVKPENIIMNYDQKKNTWYPYLTDFDLAWYSTASTQITKEGGLGTWQYSAPEQLYYTRSPIAHAPTTDIYSFGQLCYYILANNDPKPLNASENLGTMEKILGGWMIESAAKSFKELYVNCTKKEPKERFQSFRDICDIIYKIIRMLEEADPEAVITSDRFLREIIFSIIGLTPNKERSDVSFESISGNSLIIIDIIRKGINYIDIQFNIKLSSEYTIAVDGKVGYEDARKILSRRIDNLLKDECKSCSRRPGNTLPYETYITLPNIPLSLSGVQESRRILTSIIDVIERP